MTKTFVFIGMMLGSTLGSFIPLIWGASAFSISSVLLSAVGAIAGIYVGFKLSKLY